jgi:hypothetical protein
MSETISIAKSDCWDLLKDAVDHGKLEEVMAGVDRILEIDRDYLRVQHRGRAMSVPQVREELAAARKLPMGQWEEPDANLICALGIYGIAWVRLEQVDMDVRLASAISYVDRSLSLYRRLLDHAGEPVPALRSNDLWSRAAELARLRALIDAHYCRIAQIDGASWYRQELTLPRSALHECVDYTFVGERLSALTGAPVTIGTQRLPEVVRAISSRSVQTVMDALRLLATLMKVASEDPAIDADHTTILCPRGTQLTAPWEMQKDDFACYVVFHDAFVPNPNKGVGDRQLIQKAVYAHHSTKKARIAKKYRAKYCSNSPASLADDLGDMGIYFNESAHHKGHVVSGVNSAMRLLTEIEVSADGALHTIQGLTDFRVSRVSNAVDRRFDVAQFPVFREYALAMKQVLEVALSRGIILPPMMTEWRPI